MHVQQVVERRSARSRRSSALPLSGGRLLLPQPSVRAIDLFAVRWRELLLPKTSVARRARTLSARLAIQELALLARSHLLAEGRTIAASANPGHGIANIPDVAAEARLLIGHDVVLRRRRRPLKEMLDGIISRCSVADSIKGADVHRLNAISGYLEKTYVPDSLELILESILERPKELVELEALCESLVADLRARGFFDETLLELVPQGFAREFVQLDFFQLRSRVQAESVAWACYVPVKLKKFAALVPEEDGLSLVGDPRDPRSKQQFACLQVHALDPRYAGHVAIARVDSFFGAAQIFAKGGPARIDGSTVLIAVDSELSEFDTTQAYHAERRATSGARVRHHLRSAWREGGHSEGDALYGAIRHHTRATSTIDAESRFMLLWFGVERLIVGSTDHKTVLSAARALVPPAVVITKVRTDLHALATALLKLRRDSIAGLIGSGVSPRPYEALFDRIIAPKEESDELTQHFYDQPDLVQWYWKIRRSLVASTSLGGVSGPAVADYLEASGSGWNGRSCGYTALEIASRTPELDLPGSEI